MFSLRGIGTVVTGTLWSGTIGEGDELRVEPAGLDVRVRSVQVHDRPVERAAAGQRVAVALPGVERARLARGDALVEPGAYPVTYRLDIALDELEAVPAAVTVHLGTADVARPCLAAGPLRPAPARASPSSPPAATASCCGRRRRSAAASFSTRSRPGALDPERLELLERGDAGSIVHAPVREASLRHLGRRKAWSARASGSSLASGSTELREDVRARLAAADPRDPGVDLPAAPWAGAIVPLLGVDRRGSRLYLPGARPEAVGRRGAARRPRGRRARTRSGSSDTGLARVLEQEGRLVRLGDGLAVGVGRATSRPASVLVDECTAAGRITLARFRDLLGVGRRTAQLLLERFDADGLTPARRRRACPAPRRQDELSMLLVLAIVLAITGVVHGGWAVALVAGGATIEISQTSAGSGTRSAGQRRSEPRH